MKAAAEKFGPWDLIFEATGSSQVTFESLEHLGRNGVLVVTPEKTSIDNAFKFLRAALFRKIERFYQSPEVAVLLRDKMGMHLSINEEHIFDISKMVENFSGKWIAANMPIVGTDVFTQTAGIHADGDHKGGLYQSILRPERFDRKRTYALGKMSGKASLIKNLEQLDLSLSDENLKKVLQRIVELGDLKQTITEDDIPFIIADVLESKDYNHVRLVHCFITSGLDLESTVSMQVEVAGKLHKSSGTGNGGFDAFNDAINKILRKYDYKIPKLVDFEVRIPKGGDTSALTEAIITWQTQGKSMKTRGVHANQVFAAIQATLRLINLQFQERKAGIN
jgi:D-citramalate synthase